MSFINNLNIQNIHKHFFNLLNTKSEDDKLNFDFVWNLDSGEFVSKVKKIGQFNPKIYVYINSKPYIPLTWLNMSLCGCLLSIFMISCTMKGINLKKNPKIGIQSHYSKINGYYSLQSVFVHYLIQNYVNDQTLKEIILVSLEHCPAAEVLTDSIQTSFNVISKLDNTLPDSDNNNHFSFQSPPSPSSIKIESNGIWNITGDIQHYPDSLEIVEGFCEDFKAVLPMDIIDKMGGQGLYPTAVYYFIMSSCSVICFDFYHILKSRGFTCSNMEISCSFPFNERHMLFIGRSPLFNIFNFVLECNSNAPPSIIEQCKQECIKKCVVFQIISKKYPIQWTSECPSNDNI